MIFRSPKVAVPVALVCCVSVPCSVAVPPCNDTVIAVLAMGLLRASVNRTVTGGEIDAPAGVSTGCCTKAIVCAAPPMLVRLNVAVVAEPDTLAVTAYEPAMAFAVADTSALPSEFVTTEVGTSVADAPVAGAVKVTVAPQAGPPDASVTCT